VVHEEANQIFKWMLTRFADDFFRKQASHRDSNQGAMAVHLAAPTGD
jgi:hypothetical protein